MSDSRTRVMDSVDHRQPDRLPMDFGAMTSTGMHCSVIEALRDHYGLEKRLVKAMDPYQMIGYIEPDLMETLGLDATIVLPFATQFGDRVGEWKEWPAPWGQVLLVPKGMETETLDDGAVVVYPQGDRSVPPCAKLPESGYFFDALERREGEFDEDDPDPADNMADYTVLSDEAVAAVAANAREARATGKATMFTIPGTTFSSPSQLAGMALKRPRGMRRLADWYMALVAMPDFVRAIFERQVEVGLKNLEKIHRAAGRDIDIVMTCTCDFGTQISTIMSKDTLLDLFRPVYGRINGWIHENTDWRIFKHSCGAIEPFIGPLIDFGFDILNPVQCSAAGMDPQRLKDAYGGRITFWGGGVDTQRTLPFGTPAEVRSQVLERCRVFSPGGGFVFNAVHNVQARTPVENVVAMIDAVHEFNAAGK